MVLLPGSILVVSTAVVVGAVDSITVVAIVVGNGVVVIGGKVSTVVFASLPALQV